MLHKAMPDEASLMGVWVDEALYVNTHEYECRNDTYTQHFSSISQTPSCNPSSDNNTLRTRVTNSPSPT